MFLFLVSSLPLLFCLVIFLPWGPRLAPRPLTLVSTYLKGILLFFPGYLVLLVVRSAVGFSYDGFFLYLSLLLRDHLFPMVAAVGALLLLQKTMKISGTDESVFLAAFSFIAGFLSMMNMADGLRTWGTWDASLLFLLPTLRIAAVLSISLAAQRYERWEGPDGWKLCGAAAALALPLSVCSYLYSVSRVGWAFLLSVLLVLAGVAVLAVRFPRAVRA